MFNSIIIRPNSSREHPVDFGQVIENLFFYQNTTLHIGREEIKTLFTLADVDVLEQLLSLPYLSVYFNNSHTAVGNNNNVRFVDSISLVDLDLEKELYQESFNLGKDVQKSKKFSKKISRLLKIHELPQDFHKILNEQLQDNTYRQKVVEELFKVKNPHANLENLEFNLEYLDADRFKVHTNINFEENDKITVDDPILAIINACEDLHVMSENSSEISIPEFNSKMLRLKISSILEKSNEALKEIEVFNHYVYDDSWALREAINSKKIHVKPILAVLKKAEKYKHWLKELPDNSNLINEYFEKVEEKTVLEKMPLKGIKFYFFNTAQAILNQLPDGVGIPAGLALSAFETFLLDNLIQKKWKPNQFINNELRPLLKKH